MSEGSTPLTRYYLIDKGTFQAESHVNTLETEPAGTRRVACAPRLEKTVKTFPGIDCLLTTASLLQLSINRTSHFHEQLLIRDAISKLHL